MWGDGPAAVDRLRGLKFNPMPRPLTGFAGSRSLGFLNPDIARRSSRLATTFEAGKECQCRRFSHL